MSYLKGIDVSVWQTASDWSPSGLSFLIARASIGLKADAEFVNHIAKAKAAGLVTGAYHFNWDTTVVDPRSQARFFVSHAGDVDLFFLDVEGSSAFTSAESAAFIDECHQLGVKCGLYMSASAYRTGIGQDYDWPAKWSSTPPTVAWEFWQYTDALPATDGGRLDGNYFNGTLDQLKQLGATMDSFAAASSAAIIPVNKGAKVYPKYPYSGTPIVIDPARSFDYVGTVPNGPRIIRFVNAAGDATVYSVKSGYAGYVDRASCGTAVAKPDLTPFSQAQLDAAAAAQASADAAALAAAQAAVAAAEAALVTAAADEKARIAAAEAARIAAL